MFATLAIASAILWGLWAFGVGRCSREISGWMVILVSEACAGAIYVVMGLLTDQLVIDSKDLLPGLGGGVLNLGGNILLLAAYARGKLGIAAGIKPAHLLIPLGYSLLIGQQLLPSVAVGVVAILVGLVMFGVSSARLGRSQGTDLPQVFLAIGAAACYGLGIVVMDIGSRTSIYGTLAVSMVPMLIGSVLMVIITKSFTRLTPRIGIILIGSGAALGLGAVAFYAASDLGDLGVVAVIGSLSPIVTSLLAYTVLKERMTRVEVAALAIVLAGTALAVT